MKKITLAIVLLASLNNISGQNTGNQNQYDPSIRNVPTSPEVALLGRFGDIPVGHYTGTAGVSIPLHTLKVDNIEIPLTLSYQTSGIKVADEATWVGLGWSFMPEGTITQEIRGREDNISGGDGFANASGYTIFKDNFPTLYSENQNYRLQKGNVDYNGGGTTQPASDDSFDVINKLKEKRGQPDIFTYNFYGYSGKFFFNPENSGEILFLESNEDVTFSRNINGWVATTNKGDKFYFYAIERSKTDQVTDYTDIGNTFKVTKIELVSGKVINFTYQDESTFQLYPTEVAHITNFSTSPTISVSSNATINEKKTLIGVETDDTKIDFNLDNREDIRPYSASVPIKKLASIDIKSKYPNKKVKSFIFNTAYFPTGSISTVEDGYKNKRLKLNSIQEVGYNESGASIQSSPPYTFDYDLTYTMPSKMSSSDFYGYNNGSNSTSLLPNLDFFDYFNTPPYKNYGMSINYSGGTSRYTNPPYVTTNILKKVTYPTGARTEFEYESNIFTNQFVPSIGQLATPYKIESLTHRGAATVPGGYYFIRSQPFKLPLGTIKFHNTIYDGYMGPNYPQTHYDWIQMAKCKIQLRKTKMVNSQEVMTILKEWKVDVPGSVFEQTHQEVWDEDFPVPADPDPTVQYYVYVENGILYNSNDGSQRALVSSDFRYYDDTGIDHSFSYGSGIRIRSIKNYENNTLLSRKEYSYTGGKLIYGFQPLTLISGATYKSQPSFITGGCLTETISIFNDLSINSNDFGVGGNKSFGYDEVTEKDINVLDGTIKGFTKYQFTNTPRPSRKGIPKLEAPANGENVLIEKYDQNQNKVSSKLNVYDNLPNTYGVYPSFSMINTSTGPYDPGANLYPYLITGCPVVGLSYTGNSYQNPLPTTKYNFIFSPLITGKRRLIRTTDTSYFGNKTLVERTDFTYTDTGELDISTTTSSDGKISQTDYDYAYDLSNTRLLNKGMTGVPLSIEVNSGDVIANTPISHIETKYDNLENFLPSSILSASLSGSNMETEVTYNKYDSKGNLLQYTKKDGIPVALIWGYGSTKPIAKIENVTYDQAMSLIGSGDIVTKSDQDINIATQNTFIDALDLFRKSNTRLMITTYTYDPLIGVTSITPPSGIREVYLYDTANRLKEIREGNQTGKLLKEFKYNYKN